MLALYSLLLLTVPFMAAATAVPHHATAGEGEDSPKVGGQCNTGKMNCCNSVKSADDPSTAYLLSALGFVSVPVAGMIGLSCSPLTGFGVGANSCNAQPVCCAHNSFNGFINIGCTPINIAA